MRKKPLLCGIFLMIFMMAFLSIGCTGNAKDSSSSSKGRSSQNHTDERRTTSQDCLLPEAPGTAVYGNDAVSIDASNSSEGYVMICYNGSVDKVKLQITTPDQTTYTYNLALGSYETFPLQGGNGTYDIKILEHAYDDKYSVLFTQKLDVTITDEFKPFLYPNQYVWFEQNYSAVSFAKTLSEDSSNDLDYVEQVYLYVIGNITYDEELAETVTSGYLPNIDNTMRTKKGICFDYASLMAAMLRSQNIPTRLVVGYSGDAYHAWISVYLDEIGWVDGIIQFDGKSWSLMDPTLGANNSSSSVKKYVGDGSNYTVKDFY